jgi:uncharacterized membrane protein YkoI
MKLRIMSLITAMVLLLSCGTTTQTSTSSNPAYDVPATIQTSFTTQYPNATNVVWSGYDATLVPIDWEMTGWTTLDDNDYVVRFNLDNENYYAWYDSDGNWIGSAYVVNDHATLPAAVNSTITTRYPGYTIESIQKEMWKDRMAYEIKMKNGDNKAKLLVDADGNILKEKLKD